MNHDITMVKMGSSIQVSFINGLPIVAEIKNQSEDMVCVRIVIDPTDHGLWVTLFNDGTCLGTDFDFGDELRWGFGMLD